MRRRRARGRQIGVLLVNLGTPDAADAAGVRRYLKEFLTDPRVIENQGRLWKLVLNGIILPIRPRRKARDYRKIWNKEKNESPLKTITRSQAEKLGEHARAARPPHHRRLGDALRQSLDRVAARGAGRARLRAHPGDAALSAIFRGDDRDGLRRSVPRAHAHAQSAGGAHRAALLRRSRSISRRWPPRPRPSSRSSASSPTSILASFHGMPQEYVDKGDPYYAHCVETTRLLREQLELDERS